MGDKNWKEMLAQVRALSRGYLAKIWRDHQEGVPLTGEEARLADAMAAHPEWAFWWENADDLGDKEVVTSTGANPYLAIVTEAALEGMIGEGGDDEVRRTYERLRQKDLDHLQARTEISKVLLGVLWELRVDRVPPEQGRERFGHLLGRLADGETPEAMFGDETDEAS